MGKIIRCAVPAFVLVVWLLPAPPAQSLAHCPHHRVCVFAGPNLDGQQVNLSDRRHRISNKLGTEMNDQASSWVNNTPYGVTLFEHADGGGIGYCVAAYRVVLGSDVPGPYHDIFSSSKILRRKDCGP